MTLTGRALVDRRQQEHVERVVEAGDVLLVAEEEAALDHAELVGVALEALAVGAVSDEHGIRVDAALHELLKRAHDALGALHRRHAADPADDESVVVQAHLPTSLASLRVVVVDALVEVDAEPNDGELRGGRDVERDEVVADLGARRR